MKETKKFSGNLSIFFYIFRTECQVSSMSQQPIFIPCNISEGEFEIQVYNVFNPLLK